MLLSPLLNLLSCFFDLLYRILHLSKFSLNCIVSLVIFLLHDHHDDACSKYKTSCLFISVSIKRLCTHKVVRHTARGLLFWFTFPCWVIYITVPHARRLLRSIFSFFTPLFGIISSLKIFHYILYFSVSLLTVVTYLGITLFTMQIPKPRSKKIQYYQRCGPIGINNFHSVPGIAAAPIIDVPKRLLDLSSYMISQAWHGYTRKLGRNTVSLFSQINKIAKHALYLLLLFNAASALTVSNNVTSSKVHLSNLPRATCTWVTNVPTAVYSQLTHAHGAILNACPIHQSAKIMLPSEGDTS